MSQENENASLKGIVRERIGRLQVALVRVNQALLRAGSKEYLLKRICDIMVHDAGYRIAWMGWLNPQTQVVVPAAFSGEPAGEYLQKIKVAANGRDEGQGPTGMALRQRTRFVCNDFLSDSRTRPWHDAARKAGIRSSAAFPFTCGAGNVCGTMNLYSDEIDTFQSTDVALLEEIAADLSYRLGQLEEAAGREKRVPEAGERGEMFRKFAEAAGEVLWIMKVHPELILYVNPAFEQIWGRTVAELYGNPRLWMDSIHLDDRPRITEIFSNWIHRIPGSGYNVEYRIVTTDGKTRWIHDRGFALLEEGEGGSYVAGIAEDITDRKIAEENLEASRERYRGILDNMMEGCMIIGFDWTYLYVNEAAARHGYQERKNLIGRSMLSV
ncbi:MAG: PAS domain S-box protein, partial [Bacteroidetes bacterium]|nr:PAS domain S-box protein [Bacteroidota bacterium]